MAVEWVTYYVSNLTKYSNKNEWRHASLQEHRSNASHALQCNEVGHKWPHKTDGALSLLFPKKVASNLRPSQTGTETNHVSGNACKKRCMQYAAGC